MLKRGGASQSCIERLVNRALSTYPKLRNDLVLGDSLTINQSFMFGLNYNVSYFANGRALHEILRLLVRSQQRLYLGAQSLVAFT